MRQPWHYVARNTQGGSSNGDKMRVSKTQVAMVTRGESNDDKMRVGKGTSKKTPRWYQPW